MRIPTRFSSNADDHIERMTWVRDRAKKHDAFKPTFLDMKQTFDKRHGLEGWNDLPEVDQRNYLAELEQLIVKLQERAHSISNEDEKANLIAIVNGMEWFYSWVAHLQEDRQFSEDLLGAIDF